MNTIQTDLLKQIEEETPKKFKEYDLELAVLEVMDDLCRTSVLVLRNDMPLVAFERYSEFSTLIVNMMYFEGKEPDLVQNMPDSALEYDMDMFIKAVDYRYNRKLIMANTEFFSMFRKATPDERKQH